MAGPSVATDEPSGSLSKTGNLVPMLDSHKGKGKGKNRPNAKELPSKASERGGMLTRGREREMREEEENVRVGLEKLLSTGKKLIDRDGDGPSERSGDQPPHSAPIGDFSSHDLIRERIADPPSFDREDQPKKDNEELVVVSSENVPANVDNVNNRWSLTSLNPFAYLQRPQDEVSGDENPANDGSGPANVASPRDVSVEEPQLASTPNEEKGAGD